MQYKQIKRDIQEKVENHLWKNKIIIIYGARQVGKTTMVKEILKNYPEKSAYYNCEEGDVANGLSQGTSTALKHFFGDKKLIILDEAQKIRDIGIKLKLLIDNYPEMQIIATGSSSFELANIVNEPLTGRYYSFQLYSLSFNELTQIYSTIEISRLNDRFLRFGTYPGVVFLDEKEASKQISLIADSYMFKDIFLLQDIRNPEVLKRLVQLLALQLGQEVSLDELARNTRVSIETVERYLSLLEQSFVIFRLPAFSRNARNEIKKSRKIYFFDCGLRNAVISNFNQLDLRPDRGALWENYCIMEKAKSNQWKDRNPARYFWRTYNQKEIDYIEDLNGVLSAYEFKSNQDKKIKQPRQWQESYPDSAWQIVNPSGIEAFLG